VASSGPVGQVAAMDAEGGDAATWHDRWWALARNFKMLRG